MLFSINIKVRCDSNVSLVSIAFHGFLDWFWKGGAGVGCFRPIRFQPNSKGGIQGDYPTICSP